ncbi:ABC-2 family transporter protein [Streptomyces sp. RFCAC02]|uniref:ABC transporter permease n=1 Tax=Streptomyces sp. RFCAC02 TaxID=2499143 RepID=UPI00101F4C6F|nr:ABC-2 family transporter protein [Streptomyces sp. RFCAC02]
MWTRMAMTYRLSFALALVANTVTTLLDFAAILIMFSHVESLGGFTFPEVGLLYGSTSLALALAHLLMGDLSRVGARVRAGTLDQMFVRPAPVFVQLAADRFDLRRLGRAVQGIGVLVWAVPQLDVAWTAGHVGLLLMMLLSGTAIFSAVHVFGAAFQFVAQDASEVQNSFTYGGNTMLQYPPTVFARELVQGVTFVVPLAFVNWVPALRLLGKDDPLGLPGWVDFMSPAVAGVLCAAAALVWRAALRSYRSTGS